jgi:hypothetical protein
MYRKKCTMQIDGYPCPDKCENGYDYCRYHLSALSSAVPSPQAPHDYHRHETSRRTFNLLAGQERGSGLDQDPLRRTLNLLAGQERVSDLEQDPPPYDHINEHTTLITYKDSALERTRARCDRLMIAYILCIFLGFFGAHHFYIGKPINIMIGILYLFTGGLFGVGWFLDLFLLPLWIMN